MSIPPPPLIILGSERSGSNLLRKLLGNHSAIAAPRPGHFYNYFFAQAHVYGPLRDQANAQRLFEDLLACANHSRTDWKLEVTFEEFAGRYATGTFCDQVDAVHRAKAAKQGKSYYFCKDNDMARYALPILRHRPDARFLYLHRDPRDTVSSWLKTPAFFHHAFEAAYAWLNDQREVAGLRDAHGVEVCEIRYDDLVGKTGETMTRTLKFIGLDPEPACFATKPDTEVDTTKVALWQNLNKPVMSDNTGKYRDHLTPAQVEIVETICKPFMPRLGYALTTPAKWRFSGREFKLRHWWEKRAFRKANAEKIGENTREVLDKNDFIRRLLKRREKESRGA